MFRRRSLTFSLTTFDNDDILITRDNFWTLINVTINDLTHTDMVQKTLTTVTHAMMMVAKEKTQSYIE